MQQRAREVSDINAYKAMSHLLGFFERLAIPRLVLGELYVVRGNGVLRLAEICNARVVRLRNMWGFNYWAEHTSLRRRATPELLQFFLQQHEARGIVARGFKPEW